MTTLAIMKTRIANEIARDDLTSEIADAITSAIEHYQYKRWWFNEAADVTSATVAGQAYYAAPATFLDIDTVKCTDSATEWEVTPDSWYAMESRADPDDEDGRPIHRAEYQDKHRLWPIPDAVYTLTWTGLIDKAPGTFAIVSK